MLYYFTSSTHSFFFAATNLITLTKLLIIITNVGNEFCEKLLFAHLCTGCDTVSDFYGIGKRSTLNCFVENEDFGNITDVSMNPKATHCQVLKAGEKAA